MTGSTYRFQYFLSVALIVVGPVSLILTLQNTLSPHLCLVRETTKEIRQDVPTSRNASTRGAGDNSKLFVVIVAGFRTGSTLLGEIFNQNPDVNYIFEPFHGVCDEYLPYIVLSVFYTTIHSNFTIFRTIWRAV